MALTLKVKGSNTLPLSNSALPPALPPPKNGPALAKLGWHETNFSGDWADTTACVNSAPSALT